MTADRNQPADHEEEILFHLVENMWWRGSFLPTVVVSVLVFILEPVVDVVFV